MRLAEQTTSGADVAVWLTQAKIQVGNNQLEHALATLKRVQKEALKHPEALDLLQQIYLGLRDWEALATLLPDLSRGNIIDDDQRRSLSQKIFTEFLKKAAKNNQEKNTVSLDKVWDKLPADA